MANREYYSEIIDEMKKAQGKLSQALYSDLDRLAGAESNSARVKAQKEYERGVNETFEAVNALLNMHPVDCKEALETCGVDHITQVFKTENHLEMLKRIQQTVRVMKTEEPQVGDEVIYKSPMNTVKGIVIGKNTAKNSLTVFDAKNVRKFVVHGSAVEKTGRHISIGYTKDFLELLEAMKGDE